MLTWIFPQAEQVAAVTAIQLRWFRPWCHSGALALGANVESSGALELGIYTGGAAPVVIVTDLREILPPPEQVVTLENGFTVLTKE